MVFSCYHSTWRSITVAQCEIYFSLRLIPNQVQKLPGLNIVQSCRLLNALERSDQMLKRQRYVPICLESKNYERGNQIVSKKKKADHKIAIIKMILTRDTLFKFNNPFQNIVVQNSFLFYIACFIIVSRIQQQMDTVLRQKMTQLASKCQVLQKNGKFNECIDIMEQIVGIKKSVYGMDHPEFDKSAQKLCEYLNIAAMQLLQKQKFDKTLDYLRKAQLLTRNSIQFKATTYNNLACYYRRMGKVRTALSYLIQALELQLKMQNPKTLADTHLNLCAVLSQLDRHQDALQHSMLSIILLQDQFLQALMPKAKDEGDLNDQRLAVMAIAYHNLGVQFQHLKRFDEALKIYSKSLKLSKQYLSTNQQLIRNLTKVVNSATQQVEQQKKNFLQGKKSKIDKDLSQTKKGIYKDLSRTVERYRHLPKIRFNSKEHSSLAAYDPNFTINQQSIDSLPYQPQYTSVQKTTNEKNLYPKKVVTRYNKPFVDTPASRSQMDSQLKVRETAREQGFTNRQIQSYQQQ